MSVCLWRVRVGPFGGRCGMEVLESGICSMGQSASDAASEWGEPAPAPQADKPSIHDLVIRDMESRKAFGLAKYGTILQAGNGRKALKDAYEEVLDLAVYLRQELEERDQQ